METKTAETFTSLQRRNALFILNAMKKRRDSIRKGRLDPSTATFEDGLESYATYDQDKPGKTLAGLRDFALPLAHAFQGQLMQDVWALYELDGKTDGFFVDFGATNGSTLNNTFILERLFGWTGIVAEPNPGYHEALFKRRKCAISTKCVHSKSGERLEFICSTRGMMSHLAGLTEGDDIPEEERRVEVETITLNDLMDENDAPPVIDFVSIDTEGSELDILSAYDFSKRHVKLFAVEHNYKPRREAILALMIAQGYVRRFPEMSQFDDWYVHRDDLAG